MSPVRVVKLLPDAEEFHGVAVSEPVRYEVVSALRVFVASDVGQADVVLLLFREDTHEGSSNLNSGFSRFFHGVWLDGQKRSSMRSTQFSSELSPQ